VIKFRFSTSHSIGCGNGRSFWSVMVSVSGMRWEWWQGLYSAKTLHEDDAYLIYGFAPLHSHWNGKGSKKHPRIWAGPAGFVSLRAPSSTNSSSTPVPSSCTSNMKIYIYPYFKIRKVSNAFCPLHFHNFHPLCTTLSSVVHHCRQHHLNLKLKFQISPR